MPLRTLCSLLKDASRLSAPLNSVLRVLRWAVGLQPINPFLAYLSTASADGSGPVPAVRLPVHEAKPHLATTASTEAWGKLDDDSTVMSHHCGHAAQLHATVTAPAAADSR